MTNKIENYRMLIKEAAELWDNRKYHEKIEQKEFYNSLTAKEPEPNKVKSELDLLKNWMSH